MIAFCQCRVLVCVKKSVNLATAWFTLFCGERGIRTLETLSAPTHFPGVRLRPLGHLSVSGGKSTKKNYHLRAMFWLFCEFDFFWKKMSCKVESKEKKNYLCRVFGEQLCWVVRGKQVRLLYSTRCCKFHYIECSKPLLFVNGKAHSETSQKTCRKLFVSSFGR